MRTSTLKKAALTTSAMVVLYAPVAAAQTHSVSPATPYAQSQKADIYCIESKPTICASTINGAIAKKRSASHSKPAPNTEGDTLRPRNSNAPFKISVDGQTVAGEGFAHETDQRATDVGLAATDIQVRFDGLDATPMLNVGMEDNVVSVQRGRQMRFIAYSNYEAFISHAEIRLFDINQSVHDEPFLIIPVDRSGRAQELAAPDLPESIFYQLRVYDAEGRFDETQPKTVSVIDRIPLDIDITDTYYGVIGGYGVDRTLRRNINVKGGAVTVSGTHVPEGHYPSIMGRPVPVDAEGKFVTQQILPFGDQSVEVRVVNENNQGVDFRRKIHIKDTEFFYVALGDITLGQRQSVGPADLTASADEDFQNVVVNGRGAFYLKGKVKGKYLITAAMDTGEDRIKDIFKNLDEKDPRQLLRRLEADRFYPVYGDDSYTREDAPTQGRFYVRVDKGDSHVMWGNFSTQVTGTEFAQIDRGLYGGIADYNSDTTTSHGERKTEAIIFAADPGTIPGRDEFRGTGGSLYFLQRQDISIGSERLRVEIRDKVSGLVLETLNLRPQQDYDIDYIQGRILLAEPLQSTVADNQVVRDGGLSGNEAYLVARYEFTPGVTEIDGYTIGGRATQWVGDNMRLGVTAQKEATGAADQELFGTDVLLRKSENTFVKAEYARSEGPGFGQSNSADGGFIFDDIHTPGAAGRIADAYRLEAQIELKELNEALDKLNTRIRALIEHADEGFTGAGRIGSGEVDRLTFGVDTKLSQRTGVRAEFTKVESSRRGDTKAIYADVTHQFSDQWEGKVGLRYDERDSGAQTANLSPNRRDINGHRTDASAELTYKSSKNWNARAFAQGTIDKDGQRQGNSRTGFGGDIQLNPRMNLSGETSAGNGGIGANAQLSYQRDDNTELYLGYALSTDRSDTGYADANESYANSGTITAGGRKRFNDSLSIYGEEQYGYGERGRQLTHTYGVDFKPNEKWALGATVENGVITDDIDGDFERTAFSVSASRSSEGLRIASNLEGRFEDGVAQGRNRDRTTWLMRNTVAYDAGDDVELLGRLNFAVSDSDQSSILNSDYVEGVVAAAYRPIDNDRFNALTKYTYFEDLSPAQQLSNTGRARLARQKSEILSLDATYDLNERISVGGKIGVRRGEVALDRAGDDFVKSDAILGVARADYHIVKKWDALIEGRILKSELSEDQRLGALVGVYRHVGNNMKIGVGYSFSEFSDDLTNFDNNSDGAFLNLVGKF